jgi:protein phosphatase PTC7
MIPHIEKRHKGGEDAYYVDDQMLVVLDGVGGWGNSGIDPGLFSKQLALLIAEEARLKPNATLKEVLVEAVKRTTHTGSSTAVLARIDKEERDLLRTTNLGDSGYAIFRV